MNIRPYLGTSLLQLKLNKYKTKNMFIMLRLIGEEGGEPI